MMLKLQFYYDEMLQKLRGDLVELDSYLQSLLLTNGVSTIVFNDGVALNFRQKLNFKGASVEAADSPAGAETVIQFADVLNDLAGISFTEKDLLQFSGGGLKKINLNELWNQMFPVKTISANYTLLADDYYLRANAASGSITITLSGGIIGQMIEVKKIDSTGNSISFSGNTIDGVSGHQITVKGNLIRLRKTASTDWDIVG